MLSFLHFVWDVCHKHTNRKYFLLWYQFHGNRWRWFVPNKKLCTGAASYNILGANVSNLNSLSLNYLARFIHKKIETFYPSSIIQHTNCYIPRSQLAGQPRCTIARRFLHFYPSLEKTERNKRKRKEEERSGEANYI